MQKLALTSDYENLSTTLATVLVVDAIRFQQLMSEERLVLVRR